MHRVSPILDEQNKLYDLEMTKLFNLTNVQQDIKSIEVFDGYAAIIDVDDAMTIAIRPETEG